MLLCLIVDGTIRLHERGIVKRRRERLRYFHNKRLPCLGSTCNDCTKLGDVRETALHPGFGTQKTQRTSSQRGVSSTGDFQDRRRATRRRSPVSTIFLHPKRKTLYHRTNVPAGLQRLL